MNRNSVNITTALKDFNFNFYSLLDSASSVLGAWALIWCWFTWLCGSYVKLSHWYKPGVHSSLCIRDYTGSFPRVGVCDLYSKYDRDGTRAYLQCPLGKLSPHAHWPPPRPLAAPIPDLFPNHLGEMSLATVRSMAPSWPTRRVCSSTGHSPYPSPGWASSSHLYILHP